MGGAGNIGNADFFSNEEEKEYLNVGTFTNHRTFRTSKGGFEVLKDDKLYRKLCRFSKHRTFGSLKRV